jgi:hypothetical protein
LEERRPWPVGDEVGASKTMRPWPIGLKRKMANLKPKTTSYKITLVVLRNQKLTNERIE